MAEPATTARPHAVLSVDPPRLDHVFVVLDATAYRDVAASTFLRDHFARVTVKQPMGTLAGHHCAVAVAGESTLIELCPTPPFPGVSAGLVLSYETPGRIKGAGAALDGRVELVRRVVDGAADPQPWCHVLQPDLGGDGPFRLMLSEVTPEYFARIGAKVHNGQQTRRAYLDATLGRPGPGRRLRDVAVVTVRLRTERARRLVEILRALGYDEVPTSDGTMLRGPNERVRVIPGVAEPEGVVSVGLALHKSDPGRHLFGESSVLDGVIWTFRPYGGRP
jgi:hypothetical protein